MADKHNQSAQRVARLLILFFVSFLPMILAGGGRPAAAQSSPSPPVRLVYTINRTAVPPTNHSALTLRVNLDPAGLFSVTDGDDVPLPFTPAPGQPASFFVTTTGDQIVVTWQGETAAGSAPGSFAVAPLKDGKSWAWSHGMDDNTLLEEQIALFQGKSWPATLYLITRDVDNTREEDWIIDVPDINPLLDAGWAIGNHTENHLCFQKAEDMVGGVLAGQARLEEIVAGSPRPDYLVTAFAAPCFDATYQEIIAELQAAGEIPTLFNESGSNGLVLVDPGANTLFEADGYRAQPWRPDQPLGRSPFVDLGEGGKMIAQFDWMALQGNEGRYFWLNTLSHGGGEETLAPVINYLYDTYGPAGSDEVWVAPAEEIVSYLLMRDGSIVTLERNSYMPLIQTATATPPAFDLSPGTAAASPAADQEVATPPPRLSDAPQPFPAESSEEETAAAAVTSAEPPLSPPSQSPTTPSQASSSTSPLSQPLIFGAAAGVLAFLLLRLRRR